MIKTICYKSHPKNHKSILENMVLVDEVKKRNDDDGIVGLLVLHENTFLEIIEGEASKVDALFSNILKNNRHKDIIVILNEPIKELTFSSFEVDYSVLQNMDSLYALQEYVNHLEVNNKEYSYVFSNFLANLLQEHPELP
ncbi:BLUF domain-containing protein [Bizionia saleffrena]|uniref:BLUF domain-containing protein n=1 Tax=Bizionia saleffrena TaxID=291189 RepID=A0A8H2LIQ7_9FLAO|nr:BLUF domain-containing protein [Bizionia saleffrena]TYB78071.1 BLUF domain-containing protein [Bizionia saleffrena]